MKLSKKGLEELRDVMKQRDEALKAVGVMELKKVHILNEAFNVENAYAEIKIKLQDKYGKDVQIDMSDGSIEGASNDLKSIPDIKAV
jgi:DNA-binding PadR family transcriptional regulator|tara:strand:+ start:1202 stop:1462 length:261 start_codon:yes stop_codon:yes gene_type:complete